MNAIFRITRFLWLLFVLSLLAGCASLEPLGYPPETVETRALTDPESTMLGQWFNGMAASHPGQSGFKLLDKGEAALLWRGALVDRAERAIDIQTFYWKADNVGTIAAEWLLQAAQRGVRVRVLVDDFPLKVQRDYLLWLDAHPNVEIRIYNPIADVGASHLRKIINLFADWTLKNRRMHNKLFMVDNSIAITGGRNIANQYYDMGRGYNFRDRDLLVTGAVVADLSSGFDGFWNSPWAYPVAALANKSVRGELNEQKREAYYRQLTQYRSDPRHLPKRFYDGVTATQGELDALPEQLIWANARVVTDIPGKNPQLDTLTGFGQTGGMLAQAAVRAEREILIETPYLIPMPGTLAMIDRLRQRGVDLRILTNSYGSTDSPPAFAGYVRWRGTLLEKGVRLHELRPDPAMEAQLIERYAFMQEDAKMALHAKTAVFDRKWVFVGSFNLDPRSTHLNTELGLLVESEPLAREIAGIIERDMALENSWSVTREADGELRWETQRNGRRVVLGHEPDTGIGDLFKMLPFALLPMESIL